MIVITDHFPQKSKTMKRLSNSFLATLSMVMLLFVFDTNTTQAQPNFATQLQDCNTTDGLDSDAGPWKAATISNGNGELGYIPFRCGPLDTQDGVQPCTSGSPARVYEYETTGGNGDDGGTIRLIDLDGKLDSIHTRY